MKHRYDAILLPGMQFDDVRGCVDRNQISIKLDSDEGELKHRLNELQNNIVEEFSKPAVNMSRWERSRSEFLSKVKGLMEKKESRARENITQNTKNKSESAMIHNQGIIAGNNAHFEEIHF